MKSSPLLLILHLGLLLGLLFDLMGLMAYPIHAETKPEIAEVTAASSDGWIELFDGKTMNGWEERTKKDTFVVKDGAIVGTMVKDKGTTFLCTLNEYENFELTFEVNIFDLGLNSGVQIRARNKPGGGKRKYGAVYGPQVELATKGTKSRSGFIFGQGWGAWLTPKETPTHSHMKPKAWNKVRVIAMGQNVKTWINDQFIVETIIPDDRHATNSKGFIALQCHGIKDDGPYQVGWKNIRIREVKDEKK